MGLDTGYEKGSITEESGHYDPVARAGMEHDIFRRPCPYIVKNPGLAERIAELQDRRDIRIEHAIIPMRDLTEAADSRRRVQRAYPEDWMRIAPGGLVPGGDADGQESVLALQHHQLLYQLARMDTPVTFLHFPRLATDADYLHGKLFHIFDIPMSRQTFGEIFRRVARPDRIGQEIAARPILQRAPRRNRLMRRIGL